MEISTLARAIAGSAWAKPATEKIPMDPIVSEEFAKIIDRYIRALQWCSGSADFAPGGQAVEGWDKCCRPLLGERALSDEEQHFEEVEMMKSEIEKDPGYEDDFHEVLVEKQSKAKFKGHPKFYELLNELANLHSRKNHDYAGKTNPLGNLLEVEDMGMEAWVGVMVRITDKYTRMKHFVKNRKFEVNDEGLKDTLRDMAVYALLGIILYEQAQKEKPDPNEPTKS